MASMQNWESRLCMRTKASFVEGLPKSSFPTTRPASAMVTIVEQVYSLLTSLKVPRLPTRIACMVMLAMELMHHVHFSDPVPGISRFFKNL